MVLPSRRKTSERNRRPQESWSAVASLLNFKRGYEKNWIVRMNPLTAEDKERGALAPADYVAAGVEVPNWHDDPIPSLETWRRWQNAQDAALAHKRAVERANSYGKITPKAC